MFDNQPLCRAYHTAFCKATHYLAAFDYSKATDDERRLARAVARAVKGLDCDKREREALRSAGYAALVD